MPFSSACGGDRLTEERHAGFDHTLRAVPTDVLRILELRCGRERYLAVVCMLCMMACIMYGMYVHDLVPPFLLLSFSPFVPCYFTPSKSLAPVCQIGRGFLARNRPVVCRISHSSVTSVGTLPGSQAGYGTLSHLSSPEGG